MSIKKGPISKRKDHLPSTLFFGDMLVLRGVCFFLHFEFVQFAWFEKNAIFMNICIYIYLYPYSVSIYIYLYIICWGIPTVSFWFELGSLGEKIYLWKQLGLGRVLWVLLLGSWFLVYMYFCLYIHIFHIYIYTDYIQCYCLCPK